MLLVIRFYLMIYNKYYFGRGGREEMKQINNNTLKGAMNDRDPNWCVSCDKNDRCDSCDAFDFGESDCGTCDKGVECTTNG